MIINVIIDNLNILGNTMKKILCAALVLFSANAFAAEQEIVFKDKQFAPINLTIPANQKVKLTVKNLDNSPIEFESEDLKLEKIVGANGQAIVFVNNAKAGSYTFCNEFDCAATTGTITIK
jgi:hypothetical protein